MKTDVAIIGAGAAGLMCGAQAAKLGSKVVILEMSNAVAQRVIVSGGGRCNFTNLNISSENYVSNNPHFVKSALSGYQPQDFIGLLEKYHIPYEEKGQGQMFCAGPARLVVNMLCDECLKAGAGILTNVDVKSVCRKGSFRIVCNKGLLECDKLVVATGGISHRELGATDFGFNLARQFGIKVTKLRPGLVPLTLGKECKDFKGLSGISINASVSCGERSFLGDVLFTHNGLSGPAILNISSHWNEGKDIIVNLFPSSNVLKEFLDEKKKSGGLVLKNALARHVPRRFAEAWCENFAESRPLKAYSEKKLRKICGDLCSWWLRPTGTIGFNKAEVTIGGVDTHEISSQTMESKKIPGLYFIGEVLDVAGELGGYNLHWAWASGHAAGRNLKIS